MGKLMKTKSGLIYSELLCTPSYLWTASPSDASVVSTDSGIQLKHTDVYQTYTMLCPSDSTFVCIVQFDHTPWDKEDIAGIYLGQSTENFAEVQSFMGEDPNTFITIKEYVNDLLASKEPSTPEGQGSLYHYVRIMRQDKFYLVSASIDGTVWESLGETAFEDDIRIGFFTHEGTKDHQEHSSFFMNGIYFCQNDRILIHGIREDMKIELWEGNREIGLTDRLFQKNGIATIKTEQWLYPKREMTIRIKDSENTILDQIVTDVDGGDEYAFSQDIRLYYNGTQLDPENMTALGLFRTDAQCVRLEVQNFEPYDMHHIKLSVLPFSNYYYGAEQIELALHQEESLVFQKTIDIPFLASGEGISILLRVSNHISGLYGMPSDYRFRLLIE